MDVLHNLLILTRNFTVTIFEIFAQFRLRKPSSRTSFNKNIIKQSIAWLWIFHQWELRTRGGSLKCTKYQSVILATPSITDNRICVKRKSKNITIDAKNNFNFNADFLKRFNLFFRLCIFHFQNIHSEKLPFPFKQTFAGLKI